MRASRLVVPRARRASAAALLAALAAASTSCDRGGAKPEPASRAITVLAAASLREAFTDLGRRFEAAHPGTRVELSFGGSQELSMQLEHGAQADVFASADVEHASALAARGLVGAPILFARNELAIAVSRATRGSRPDVRGVADLANVERLVLGVSEVPIGRYAAIVLERASRGRPGLRAAIEARVVSREPNVRQVLAKVALGEADAAIVYRSDVAATSGVDVVPIPSDENVVADYAVALVSAAPNPEGARAWADLVTSAEGQAALVRAGFLAPAASAVAGGR